MAGKIVKSQEDIDTAKVIVKRDTQVTFESIDLGPGERGEIILSPERALRAPVLFMSNSEKDSNVVVEQISHGRSPIFEREILTINQLRFGKGTGLTVTESEPIKILVVNSSLLRTTVGASLVANESTSDTTYHFKGAELAKDKD